MFRVVTVIVLLCSFAAQSFMGTFIILDYHYNKSAFVKNCENKTRPQLHCNGQCVLMKKLQDAEKKEQQVPERKLEIKNDWVSTRAFLNTMPSPLVTISSEYNLPLIHQPSRGFLHAIFHPPSVA